MYRYMEYVTFGTLHRVGGRNIIFGRTESCPPLDENRFSCRLQVDIAHPPQRGTSAVSCIGAPLPVVKDIGGLAKNSSMTKGKFIDPTMIRPSPLHGVSSVGSLRPPMSTETRLCKPLALGYSQNVP
jgi:hypothetical protein